MVRILWIVAVMVAGALLLGGCSTAGDLPDEAALGSSTPKPNKPPPPRMWKPDGKRESVPESRPDITGVITEAERGDGEGAPPIERVLVEEDPGADCRRDPVEAGCDKLYLALHRETGIFREGGSGAQAVARVRVAELHEGQRVHAWHTGVVM